MRVSCLLPVALAFALLSCSTDDKVQAPRLYRMGDRAQAGNLFYTVLDRQWRNEFGEGPAARLPENRFYLVRISVENNSATEAIVPGIELVDDSGAAFPELTDGDGVQDWIGNTRQVKPSVANQGYVLFDVQPKHYKLRVWGEEEKQAALVDLPLSFDSDLPDVTTPLDSNRIPVKK